MIFLDSNIPMYLVGVAHPNKERACELLERMIHARDKLVTDAEVFQEVLHRYTAIRRRDAIEPAWSALADLVDEVFPLDQETVTAARDLVLEHERLSARDAVHAAAMATNGVDRILSFDAGFDRIESVRRIF